MPISQIHQRQFCSFQSHEQISGDQLSTSDHGVNLEHLGVDVYTFTHQT